nr:unnamed protein product [Leishmania braziliensis]
MATPHHLYPAERAREGIYVRSPLTEAEEAMQFLPGSRFLSSTEFKRVYLGGGIDNESSTAAAERWSSSSPNGTFSKTAQPCSLLESYVSRGARAGSLPHAIHAPCRQATTAVARFHRKDNDRRTARQLRCLYGGVDGRIRVSDTFEIHTPSPPRSSALRPTVDEQGPCRPKRLTSKAPPAVAPSALCSAHTPLPHQLRSRVCSARCAMSSPMRTTSGAEQLHRGQLRTEDAWLAVTRELTDKKREAQNLQQQLQRAHVLLRSLHGVTANMLDEDADASGVADPATAMTAGRKSTGDGVPGVATSVEQLRPREYWQRRAYFLLKQNEELRAESERFRRSSHRTKVHALLQELKSVRGELSRYRTQASAVATSLASANEVEPDAGGSGIDLGIPQHDNGKMINDPVTLRLIPCSSAVSSFLVPSIDDGVLRQKDDAIRNLQERLQLLTQQYEKTDVELITTKRRLEDMMHHYSAMQAEWRALAQLPQELARAQQQLATTQTRLLDCDRELVAFHQLLDTQASPTTLRALIDERDHLVELLRQRQQSEAALRNEMNVVQQQMVQSVEQKYQRLSAEQHAMSRDREAQHEETILRLRKEVATLEHLLGVQREAFDAQQAEHAGELEEELAQRLLELVRRPEAGAGGNDLFAPRSLNITALPQPTSHDGQPPTAAESRLPLGEASLARTPAATPALLRHPGTEHAKMDPLLRTASSLEGVASSYSAGVVASPTAAQDDTPTHADRDAGDSTLSSMSETIDSSASNNSLTSDCNDEVTSLSSAPTHPSRSHTGDSADSTSSEYLSDILALQQLASDDDDVVTATDEMSVTSASSSAEEAYSDSEDEGRDEKMAEKPSTPDSDSSIASSADSSPHPTLGAEGAAKQQRSATSTTNTSSAHAQDYVIDLPAQQVDMVSPVSIFINRTSSTGPLFSSDLRVVVHSPPMSLQPTESVTDFTTTQQTLPSTSETKNGSNSSSSGSFSPSSSLSSLGSPPSDVSNDAASPSVDLHAREPHGVPVRQMEEGRVETPSSSLISGAPVLVESIMQSTLPLPDPDATAPSTVALPGNERRSPLSLLRSPGANAPTILLKHGVPIPPPAALTPVVASNLYPPRHASSFLLTGIANDDHFNGSGAEVSRGGMVSRINSNIHNTSFDLAHQYSGNASFDFVGPLAERHRLEDMQSTLVSSRQSSSTTVTVGGDVGSAASAIPSEALGSISRGGGALMGAGAAGVRKTPSPSFRTDALQTSKSVFFTRDEDHDERATGAAPTAGIANAEQRGEERASDLGSGSSFTGISYQGGVDDMASSISAERVAAETREREVSLARELPYAGPIGSACGMASSEDVSVAKAPVPSETMQVDLAAGADRDAFSPTAATALSRANFANLSPISKSLPQEEHTPLSFNPEGRGEAKLEAGDAESATPPSDQSPTVPPTEALTTQPGVTDVELPALPAAAAITMATPASPFVPFPPQVAIPASPRAARPSPSPPKFFPLPPRVAVPLPPST